VSRTGSGRLETPVAALLGAATGALVGGTVAVGEAQATSAAGGAVHGFAGGVLIVAPQWATVVAAATALIVAGALAAAWELTARRGHRAFWIALLVPLVALILVGTALSPAVLDPQGHTEVGDLLARAAHSPLLIATVLVAAFVSTRSRGRLDG
jgi:cytochrome bd-type quinol oxidase subunit 2